MSNREKKKGGDRAWRWPVIFPWRRATLQWLYEKHPDCRMVGMDGNPVYYMATTTRVCLRMRSVLLPSLLWCSGATRISSSGIRAGGRVPLVSEVCNGRELLIPEHRGFSS